MSDKENFDTRETRSFLMARDPSIDRRFRPRPQKKLRLFENIKEDENTICIDDSLPYTENEFSKVDSEYSSTSTVNSDCSASVFLRLRPVDIMSTTYSIGGNNNVLVTGPSNEASSSSNNKNSMEKHYSFSEIFDTHVEQKDIYEKCISKKISMEESFTILTYGTSGSGKTFTLLGTEDKPGIIPRALENIFVLYASNIYPHAALKLINATVTIMDDAAMAKEMDIRQRILRTCAELPTQYSQQHQIIRNEHVFNTIVLDDASILIWVSFVEIYNEVVNDLLAPTSSSTSMHQSITSMRKNLKIVGNDGKVFVKGLTSVYVKNSIEALKLLRFGLERVTYASTLINAKSSRSHCIFVVDVLKYTRAGVISETSYKFCDLAGSERLDKTGNIGSRLKEAQRINTSLLVLGRCLDAANANNRRKNDIIPYRESKLTMLLQSSLLGKEKLTMIVNVTPIDKYYEENLNVLNFASIARNIIFKAPAIKQHNSRYSFIRDYVNGSKDDNSNAAYIKQIVDENIFLRNEVDRLNQEKEDIEIYYRTELMRQETKLRNELVDSFQTTLDKNKQQFKTDTQREIEFLERVHKRRFEAMEKQYEEELTDLREENDELLEKLESKKPKLSE